MEPFLVTFVYGEIDYMIMVSPVFKGKDVVCFEFSLDERVFQITPLAPVNNHIKWVDYNTRHTSEFIQAMGEAIEQRDV